MSHALSHPTTAATREAARLQSGARAYWNPYVAGFLLGLVLLSTYVLTGRGLGASGAFGSVSAWIVGLASPEHAQADAVHARYWNDGAPLLVLDAVPAARRGSRRLPVGLARPAPVLVGRTRAARVGRHAAAAGLWRRLHRCLRRQDRQGLHQRPGADRRLDAQCRQLGLHARRLRFGAMRWPISCARSGCDVAAVVDGRVQHWPCRLGHGPAARRRVSASASNAPASAARAS